MFMAACVSDKSVDGRGSGDYKAEITSFGFYAEDNAGVLVLDYEGEITGHFKAGEITKEEIGYYMTGSRRKEADKVDAS